MAASQNPPKYPTMSEVKIINHLYIILPGYHLSFLLICFSYHNVYLFIYLALGAG